MLRASIRASRRDGVEIPVKIGLLDIDPHLPKHFDEADQKGSRLIVRMLEETWNP